jgi:phage shock protein PspC (stress-responsive transcriptional regulator)
MKKTIHINLSGMAFKIEEDAYEILDSYLDAIKSRLGQEESAETINDIESRMAELFSAVLLSSDKAITVSDVEAVIKTLGDPEDFGSDDNTEKTGKKSAQWKERRLFRDPNNRVLAGVCSGLGTYFNLDPVLFRILFILGLFTGGISILPYILLWIFVPKAQTIEQRARMTAGYDHSTSRRRTETYKFNQQPETGIVKGLKTFLGVLIVIGTALTMFGLIITFFVSNIAISSSFHAGWLRELTELLIDSTSVVYALIGAGLVLGIPVLLIFYLGLHLIFNFKRGGKLIGLTGFLLWLIGIGLIVFVSLNTVTQFNERAIVTQTDLLQPVESDTIFIKQTPYENYGKRESYNRLNRHKFRSRNFNISIHDKRIDKDNHTTVYVNKQMTVEGRPIINIVENADKLAITIEREGKGSNNKQAEENALNIDYFWVQKDNTSLMDRIFTLAESSPIRGQKLIIKIEIPDDYHLKIEPSIDVLVRNF